MASDTITMTVDVSAPQEVVWQAVTDWERQGEWVIGTRVRVVSGGGQGVGAEMEAFTGVGPLGVRDPMVIEEWDPPRRCAVRHVGRVVRGPASFEVVPLDARRSRVVWVEQLEIPFGQVGRMVWTVVRPAFRAGIGRSLSRFAVQVQARHTAGEPG